MSIRLIIALLAGFMLADQASAQQRLRDCGEEPLDLPTIPGGEAISADIIRETRRAVLDYSDKVDAYLSCMDVRANTLFTYMTEKQRTQFNNDLADVHNRRRSLQIKMNEAIRAYRDSQRRN